MRERVCALEVQKPAIMLRSQLQGIQDCLRVPYLGEDPCIAWFSQHPSDACSYPWRLSSPCFLTGLFGKEPQAGIAWNVVSGVGEDTS